ncbi:MAG: zf-HC2 domain-containing protein [Sedimentisphaerales bacterium]|nr:zf-HC2 domain-containing protein [Sedimentisphaerales bacterium]
MIKHLDQDQLIKYQFNLASDAQKDAVREHLETCDECRKRLEQLKHKFSALDVLQAEKVSEELIEQTLDNLPKVAPAARPIYFRLPAWPAAAATIIIVVGGVLWWQAINEPMQPNNVWVNIEGEQVARDETKVEDIAMGVKTVPSSPPIVAKTLRESDKIDRVPAEEWVSEKPPFAPASNIELVTLPRRENVQITIYNHADLTLVREQRNLTLKKGWNWLQFMWADTLIDPTSLHLEPQKHAGQIEVEQLVFPPRLPQLGRWLIKSQVSGRAPFEISYFTAGIEWRAFYMGTLAEDEHTMILQGYVRVDNYSGEEYENAQTRLIVGEVHLLDQIVELALRQYAYGGPVPGFYDMDDSSGAVWGALKSPDRIYGMMGGYAGDMKFEGNQKIKQIVKEGLSEYFLYTIEGTETIPDGWGKRLPSFKTENIPVESLYKYDEQRWGKQTVRFLTFTNDEEHKLGRTPIPDGIIKIYRQINEQENLSFVGGSYMKYIPVNEEVELDLGPAQKVMVEPKVMAMHTENYIFDYKANISGWDEVREWEITVTNARDLAIEVEITHNLGTAYWTLAMIHPQVGYAKHDMTRARFTLEVEPMTKFKFTFTERIYQGQRQEAYDKQL